MTENEQNIDLEVLENETKSEIETPIKKNQDKKNQDKEKELHKFWGTYLKSRKTYLKTIRHEESNGADKNQTWTHPDMVGVKFWELKSDVSKTFLKYINPANVLELSSYELKIEINSDRELKQAFFQAVSNSSWANYGYLVALEFGGNVQEELKRLSESFGIGIIQLDADPYRSKVLFPPKYRELDFKMIDKICEQQKDKAFSQFFEHIQLILTGNEQKSVGLFKKALEEFCADSHFKNEEEIENSCGQYDIKTKE